MSRMVAWVLRLLPLLGIVLLVVGSQEWYPEHLLDSKGYVINLASGLTAACFGLPLAYIVLQTFVKQREQVERKEQVLRLAYVSLEKLHDASEILLPDEIFVDLTRQLREASAHLPELDSNSPIRDQIASSLSSAVVQAYPRPVLVSERWNNMRSTWNYILTDLRFRANFEGIELIDERADRFMSEYLTIESPVSGVFDVAAWKQKQEATPKLRALMVADIPETLDEAVQIALNSIAIINELRFLMLGQMTHLRQIASAHSVTLPAETSALEGKLTTSG